MKQKIGLLIIFISAYVFGLSHSDETFAAEFTNCYTNTPIPMKNGAYDTDKINAFLKEKGISPTLGTKKINIQMLYYRHIVLYGAPFDTKDSTKLCQGQVSGGMSVYRYMGYSEHNVPIHDPNKKPDSGGGGNWVQTRIFAIDPWTNSTIRGMGDYHRKEYDSASQKVADLNRAIDSFAPRKNLGRGFFAEKHRYWCEINGNLVKNNNGCGSKGAILNGKNLARFAVISSPATKYSAGGFTLWHYSGRYWYGGFAIPPQDDPFDATYDASVTLKPSKTTYSMEKLTGNINIKQTGEKDKPLDISLECNSSKNNTQMQCKTTTPASSKEGGIKVTDASGKVVLEKAIKVPVIKQGTAKDVKLDDFDFTFKSAGKHTIKVWIPEYVDAKKNEEETYTNNVVTTTVNVVFSQNASVEVGGTNNYTIGVPLTNVVTVKNNTKVALTGPITIQILDFDKKVVHSVPTDTPTFTSLGVGKSFKLDLTKYNISLDEVGDYFISAKIKHYTELPESTYVDNSSLYPISVGPFIPENTECNMLESKVIKVIPVKDLDPGVTRFCIGWAPNYPSTRIEGGQGTYFYFAYKLIPQPMPAYKVTTLDRFGIKQKLEIQEPLNTLGACDYRIEKDTNCRLYEPFIYYPSKWESRFTGTLANFAGPYTAGPHEYYHYMYRGRMVPKSIDFNFKVIDMKENEIDGGKDGKALAHGTLIYDVPDECYRTDLIDVVEECRLIQFYIPTTDITKARLKLPEDALPNGIPEEKIHFVNPGEHTFRVEVDENQIYLYQQDMGAEWQGKEGIYRDKWGTETTKYSIGPVKTYTTKGTAPKEWVNQDTYKNHCYSEEDGFGDTGKWTLPTSNFNEIDSPAIVCFHNHSDDFHYWKFDWTKPKKFGKDGFIQ